MCRVILLMLTIWLLPMFSSAAIVLGNPNGTISLTEVYDYQCPHCRAESSSIETLENQFPEIKIRLLPVALLNATSLVEATSAYAAALQSNTLNQLNREYFLTELRTPEDVNNLLNRLQLLTPKFIQTMHGTFLEKQLLEGINVLKQYHANGVPLIIISRGNQIIAVHLGETPLSTLQQEISNVVSH